MYPYAVPALTKIGTYLSPWEAEIARGLLESEGVPAVLGNAHQVGAQFPLALALGGVRLEVPVEYETQAKAILARQRNGEYEEALESEFQLPANVCARCGSRKLRAVRSWRSILLLFVAFEFANAIFPPKGKGRRCQECGHLQPDAP